MIAENIKKHFQKQSDYSKQIIGIAWFRVALVVVAIGFPLVGLFNNAFLPNFNDPMLPRVILSIMCLILFAGTYLHPIFIRYFYRFLTIILFFVFIGSAILCFTNNTSIIGVSLYIVSMAIVTMSLRQSVSVLVFNTIAFIISLLLLLNSNLQRVDTIFILIIILLMLFVSYTISRIRNIADKKLIESERKYRLLAENITDVIWIFNVKTMRFNYISPSIELLTGFTPAETTGKAIDEIFAPESVLLLNSTFKNSVRGFLRNQNQSSSHQLKQFCKKGNYVWVETTAKYYRSASGEIEVLGVTRNIETRKHDEIQLQNYAEKMQRMNRDKDRLLSILAHDLRSPFNTILGFSSLLVKNATKLDSEKVATQAGIINKTAQNAYELLDDLLLWGKTQSDKLSIEPEVLNLSAIGNEVMDDFKSAAHFKEITITVRIQAEIEIKADRFILKTVLRNLISNAVKFTPQGGQIRISAHIDKNAVIIEVADTGIGIEAENLPKLWDMSTEYSTKGTNNEKGTGLGLLICKELIEKHGGQIWAESTKNVSSTFIVSIPQ